MKKGSPIDRDSLFKQAQVSEFLWSYGSIKCEGPRRIPRVDSLLVRNQIIAELPGMEAWEHNTFTY